MFIAALCSVARTWKQPKCPSTEAWREKMRPVYTMKYYSAVQKNEMMPFATTWMDPDIVIPSEASQRTRNIKWHSLYAESKSKWYKWTYLQNRNRLTDLENKLMVTRGKGWGEGIVNEFGTDMSTLLYLKWITKQGPTVQHRKLCSVWQPGWEGSLGENGYMLLSTWNYHTIVNCLYSNIK